MNTQNLQKRCIEFVKPDPEVFKFFWTKWIVAVDRNKDTGFAFAGDFFENDTIEIEPKIHLVLFAASTGQHGYPVKKRIKRSGYQMIYEYHEILLLLPTGELERTGLVSEDDKRWAIALRDQASMLLDKINQAYGADTPLQIATDHFLDRLLGVRMGNTQQWSEVDANMLQIIFKAIEPHRST